MQSMLQDFEENMKSKSCYQKPYVSRENDLFTQIKCKIKMISIIKR